MTPNGGPADRLPGRHSPLTLGLVRCEECGATIHGDAEASPWVLCRFCKRRPAVAPPQLPGPAGAAILWDPAWDTEPVPEPPKQRPGGPGAPRTLPRVTAAEQKRCPACDSDSTHVLSSWRERGFGYRQCLGCGQRYSWEEER